MRPDGRKRCQEPPARYFSGDASLSSERTTTSGIGRDCPVSDTLRGLRSVNLSISSLLPGFSGQGAQEMGTNTEVAKVELTDAEIAAVAGGAKETEASIGIKG